MAVAVNIEKLFKVGRVFLFIGFGLFSPANVSNFDQIVNVTINQAKFHQMAQLRRFRLEEKLSKIILSTLIKKGHQMCPSIYPNTKLKLDLNKCG
jgi:hypothetical protein